ncbi:MAG TPA: carboxypeptidase-like regulatory domain-containing protein [Vicinamibacterales bacterium]|nr:carboxypeptidase-like regulatory domain-containing protein [Vicinamibacterales bacterium]
MRVILITTAALIFTACGGGGSSSPSQSTPTAPITSNPPVTSNPPGTGALGGTVTVNGEAFPLAWVETLGGWGFATTMPGGSWEWERISPGDWVVLIKMPPGVTCDAMRKSATVVSGQRTLVNFACLGEVKGSIVGIATHEFGTAASVRVTLTGPVNREAISNQDGFFAFENLPPGEYSMKWCTAVSASVRDGATAFVNLDCS